MLTCLLVCAGLSLGQPVSPAPPPAEAASVPAAEETAPVLPPRAALALPLPPVPPTPSPPDRWLLMKTLQGTWPGWLLDANRMQLTGWIETSYTASSADHGNLPLGFNYKANQFAVQQNWVRFERTVVTTGTSEPTWGFRSDWILPGIDYRFTLARGVLDSQLTGDHGQPNTYGVDPIQFYGEAYFPTIGRGLDVKVGRFFALYGVETNDAVSNALASHAYTFIYDPFTHTGAVATLKLTDTWTVQAGLVLGSDIFIDSADEPTFIGSVKWTRSDQRDSVLFSWIIGSGRFNQRKDFNNPDVLDLVYTHQFNPRLNYSFESLLGYQTHVTDIGTAHWLGVLNYFTYNLTPRLSGTARLELFDDEQGQRTGSKGRYTALTTGLSFRPRKEIIFRPELRYDYNDRSRPFEDKHGLWTANTDLILRW